MAYQINYAYTCHKGRVRGNNEDNFWCCGNTLPADNQGMEEIYTGSVPESRLPVLAVFDGMGGESCGEMAAFLAAGELGHYYEEYRRSIRKTPEEFIVGACKSMNRAVCQYAKDNRIGSMGTTMAMAVFAPDAFYAGNLGDSRIYVSGDGEFYQLSTDHVLSGKKFGKVPLTQYLGVEEEQYFLEPSVEEIEYRDGCRLLLCSDGVTDMLSDKEISGILMGDATLRETVSELLEQALKHGGRDNITIILCEIQRQEYKERVRTWLRKMMMAGDGPGSRKETGDTI